MQGRKTRNKTTILVGEDRENWRGTFCDLLVDEGYDVLPASHGDQVRALAPQADVIVLDISMPMKHGGPESRTAGLDVLLDLQQQYPDHAAIQGPIVRSMWTPEDFKDSPRFKAAKYQRWVSRNEPIANLLRMIARAAGQPRRRTPNEQG